MKKNFKKVFPYLLSCSLALGNFIPVYAIADTQVNGTIQASIIDISATSTANYTVDGKTLTSDTIGIINNSNFPISLGVANVQKTKGTIEDVLPETVGNRKSWFNLGRNETKSKIALGLKKTEGTYIVSDRSDTVYFKEIKDNGKPIRLGAIAAKGSISYNLDGFYGLAFDSNLNEQYKITWNAELYGLPTFKLLTGLVKAEVDKNTIQANFSYAQPVAGDAYRDGLLTKREKPGVVEPWNFLYVNGTIKLTGSGKINQYTATSITVPNYYYDNYGKKYYKVNEIGDNAINPHSESFARLEIPYGIEKIGNGAFSGSGKSRLYYVVIPDSVKSIGTESFSHHDKLKFLFYNGKATGAPWGATNATVYPYTDEVEEFLNSNTFTASDTYASIYPRASLTSVEASIPSFLKDYTVDVDLYDVNPSYGSGNTSLTSVVLKEGITEMDGTLEGCTNLSKIVFPQSYTGQTLGYNGVFKNCQNLKAISIPASVKLIGKEDYSGCTALAKIDLPSSLVEIGQNSFKNCTAITEITIPDTCTSIDETAFTGCTNLTTIHYNGTATGAPWGATNATVVQ